MIVKIILVAGSAILACVVCGAGFFLLRQLLYHMIDCRIERFQSDLLEKQLHEIQNLYRQVRGWRHDYRNHIHNMKIQLADGNYEKLSDYLDQLADDLDSVDTVVKTGNVMADAILNSKLSTAGRLNVRLHVKAHIPAAVPVSDVELCSVLGNLLDNAVESCAKLPENQRFIRVYIGALKGQFYLSVQNAAGRVRRERGVYLSTKEAVGNSHGYGLMRIDRIARKYGGYVNRQSEEGIFATELMIPLDMA